MDEEKAPERKSSSWLWGLRFIPLYAVYDSLSRKRLGLWEALFIGLSVWAVIEGILWVLRRILRKDD